MHLQTVTRSFSLLGLGFAAFALGPGVLPSSNTALRGGDSDWVVYPGVGIQSEGLGSVSIGAFPSGEVKLAVVADSAAMRVAGSFVKTAAPEQIGGSIGVQGICKGHEAAGVGVKAQASSDQLSATNIGVSSLSFGNSTANFGVSAQAFGEPTNLCVGVQTVAAASSTPVQYGLFSVSGLSHNNVQSNYAGRLIAYGSDGEPGSQNYAGHFRANPGQGTEMNVALHASAVRPPSGIPGSPGFNVGLYSYADDDGLFNRAAFLNGSVEVTGAVYLSSDRKLKRNIRPAEDGALALLQGLEIQAYSYRDDIPEMSLPKGDQRGFIAQDVERLFPGLVSTSVRPAVRNEKGEEVSATLEYKSVNYIGFVPILTQALQEQQQEILDLREEIERIRSDAETLRLAVLALQEGL